MFHEIADRYNLEAFYVFGSRAKEVLAFIAGNIGVLPESLSDVDIGVKPVYGTRLSVSEKVELAQKIEDMLDVPRVDLLVIPEVDPFVAANIIRGERLYCRDEYLADEYDLFILRRAGDLLPLERERQALIMEEGE
ncbi:MAG: nucleotidyltransferase domain-containing protein [Thermodesulfobacteriota bacterium]